MPHLVFVLSLPFAFAHKPCQPSLVSKRDAYAQARRIAVATERVVAAAGDRVAALDELLTACRDVGSGRIERSVKLRLKPVVPTVSALLDEAEPAARWPLAYALTALRRPDLAISAVHAADEVSDEMRDTVRREVERHLALKNQWLITRVSVRQVRLDARGWTIKVGLNVSNEFELSAAGRAPRLPLPDGLGIAPRVWVTVSALGTEVTGGASFAARVGEDRLNVAHEVTVRAPAGTVLGGISLFVDVSVANQPVARQLISGAALAAAVTR